MTKRDFEMKSDGLGIGLFAFGVFSAVLVVQAMLQGVEPEPTQFVKVLAALWVGSIGAFPSLVLNGALAAIGARIFLAGAVPNLVRHLVGLGFLSASLALLFGAFGGTAGGAFGARTGGALSGATHVALGALIGALAAVATVWFVWIRRDPLPAEEPMSVRNPDRELEAVDEDEGVSTAEAEALLPIPPAAVAAPVRTAPPPSPYPEDVRRKGEIPAGTRPLSNPNAPAGPAVYRWTAPGAHREPEPAREVSVRPVAAQVEPELAEDALDADRYTVAEVESEAPQARAADKADVAAKLGALPRPAWEEGDEDGPVDAYGTPLALVEELRKDADDEDEVAEVRPLAAHAIEEDEEPASMEDEAPLEAAVAALDETDEDELDEDETGFELVVYDLDKDEAELEGPATAPATFAESDHDDETSEAETERTALRAEMRSLAFVTETEADSDELELAAEPELATPAGEDELSIAVRGLEAETIVVEPALEPESSTTQLVTEPAPMESATFAVATETPAAEDAPAEPAAPTLFAGTESAPAEPEPAPPEADEPRADHGRKSTRVQEPSLFDASAEPVSSVFATEPEPAPAPASKRKSRTRVVEEPELVAAAVTEPETETEREVILTPPAVAAERTHKTPHGTLTGERVALLAEVGCLFIDRGRVAVSMLQRQYSMEFDDACKVLDELQDMGLIGPYLGGQRRDILLSREAWLEKVGTN